jgi:hypothetical protein
MASVAATTSQGSLLRTSKTINTGNHSHGMSSAPLQFNVRPRYLSIAHSVWRDERHFTGGHVLIGCKFSIPLLRCTLRLPELIAGDYVSRANWKRQPSLLDDLPQKYTYRIAQPKAARIQYRRGFGLEVFINSSSNDALFHGTHCSYIPE